MLECYFWGTYPGLLHYYNPKAANIASILSLNYVYNIIILVAYLAYMFS